MQYTKDVAHREVRPPERLLSNGGLGSRRAESSFLKPVLFSLCIMELEVTG